ncbi:hypothetical protein E2320_014559 [Naja naja]|nr:hypothetical protein E2320_014559 [Naja naja]
MDISGQSPPPVAVRREIADSNSSTLWVLVMGPTSAKTDLGREQLWPRAVNMSICSERKKVKRKGVRSITTEVLNDLWPGYFWNRISISEAEVRLSSAATFHLTKKLHLLSQPTKDTLCSFAWKSRNASDPKEGGLLKKTSPITLGNVFYFG